jgi:hypothetical protein
MSCRGSQPPQQRRCERFRHLLEKQHPDLKFNWKEIRGTIEAHLDALPDLQPSL